MDKEENNAVQIFISCYKVTDAPAVVWGISINPLSSVYHQEQTSSTGCDDTDPR